MSAESVLDAVLDSIVTLAYLWKNDTNTERLQPHLQSELRVRHREECKNVTRLTMENVS